MLFKTIVVNLGLARNKLKIELSMQSALDVDPGLISFLKRGMPLCPPQPEALAFVSECSKLMRSAHRRLRHLKAQTSAVT